MAKTKLLEGYSSEQEVARQLGIAVRTLQKWRELKIGPAWTRMGKRAVYYRDAAILEYLAAQEVKPVRSRKVARSAEARAGA